MDFLRIGDKIISRDKLNSQIERIFDLRVQGFSQQEVARRLSLDRALISRLETMGEVRKGSRIAVLAFPVQNKAELLTAVAEEGIDFSLVMTEKERWAYVDEKSGLELFNKVTDLMSRLKSYDSLLVIASNKRIKFFQSIFSQEVVGLEIGPSPICEDKFVDVDAVRTLIRGLKGSSCREGLA